MLQQAWLGVATCEGSPTLTPFTPDLAALGAQLIQEGIALSTELRGPAIIVSREAHGLV